MREGGRGQERVRQQKGGGLDGLGMDESVGGPLTQRQHGGSVQFVLCYSKQTHVRDAQS